MRLKNIAFAAVVCLPILVLATGCGPRESTRKHDPIADPEAARAKVFAAQQAELKAAQHDAAVAAYNATPDCKPDGFRFAPAAAIGPAERKKLDIEQPPATESLSMGPSKRLAVVTFDYEDYPTQGPWSAVGTIYSRPDTGAPFKMVGVLWTRRGGLSDAGGGLFETDAQGEVMTVALHPEYLDRNETKLKCVYRYRIRLERDGALTADGRKIGDAR